ncbi:AraC family transcriptional regulator [Lichenicoccus sp.]|uniref:AraC family transcriptional regulator n=1 Tax=Lichenicoccus sp. TaxID=2781899 RepID=UPI003D0BCA0D
MEIEAMVSEQAALAAEYASSPPARSAVPALMIRCSAEPTAPVPALFEPVFYVVLQGSKRLTFAGRTHDFGAGTCAVASVGLPFVSQVIEASAAKPYVGAELRLDPGVVADLLMTLPDASEREAPSFAAAPAESEILEPFGRMLRLLATPADAPVLAGPFARELCYRLLQGPLGDTLGQVGRRGSRFAQIRAAADWIGCNANKPLSVKRLAGDVGMSSTSLHRHFKAVTGYSPLAYQRYLRLLEARRILHAGNTPVTTTAFTVGYASPSQFSREYKRMFGEPPVRDIKLREPLRSRNSLHLVSHL